MAFAAQALLLPVVVASVQFGLVGFHFGLGWSVLVNITGVFPENFNDLGIFFIQGWSWVGVGERG